MLGRFYGLLVLAVLAQSRSSSLTGTCAWETSVSHSANRIPTSITEVYCAQVGVPCGRGVFCRVCIFGVSQQVLDWNVFKENLKIFNLRILTFFAIKNSSIWRNNVNKLSRIFRFLWFWEVFFLLLNLYPKLVGTPGMFSKLCQHIIKFVFYSALNCLRWWKLPTLNKWMIKK